MHIKKVLKPFKRRLNAEALLRASLSAGLIAAGVALILGGIHVLLPWMISEGWILLIFAAVFTVSLGLLFLLAYRPTKQSLARRLDELGLSERVETMLELEQSNAPAAILQREDTVNRLKQMPKKDLRIRFSKVRVILCALLLICATALLFVPEVKLFSRHAVINRLHELLDDSEVSGDLQKDLAEIIDDLENELENAENEEDYAEDLQDAQESIQDLMDQEITKEEIGEALQNFEDLKELGEAIQKGDLEGVSTALDHLQELMEEEPAKQESTADQIRDALAQSGASPDNTLHQALQHMETGLRDPSRPLKETMTQAESEIREALGKQQDLFVLNQQMQDALENANPIGGEGDTQPGPPQDGSSADSSDGSANGEPGGSSSDGSNEENGNGMAGDGSGDEGNIPTEEDMISDPSAQKPIQYSDVYAAYVAEFLKHAEDGGLPPDVIAAMNEYLESLGK